MIELFGFYIEFTDEYLLSQGPLGAVWFFLKNGFWVVFLFVLVTGFYKVWLNYRQGKFQSKWRHVLLAIDIPKDNEQTPKAVENIFAHLSGSHTDPNRWEKYWEGKTQESYSLEIISIGGYVRFLIRTVDSFRDLVEAAIYAQYPTAEIVEVEDYTDKVPHHYPNEEYNLWGTELVLYAKEHYPIKTYMDFEHQIAQEMKDPMAATLEILGKLQTDEQVWLQLVITPINDKWKTDSMKLVKKLIGAKVEPKKSWFGKLLVEPTNLWLETQSQVLGLAGSENKKDDMSSQFGKMFSMPPGERRTVELIERKASKIGFRTKFRMIYAAPKEIFAKGRGVAAVVGAIKQFNTQDMNGFKPDKLTKTKVDHFFVNRRVAARQRKLISAYAARSNWRGSGPGKIFNTEELATIWHFPMIGVKAPLIQKAGSKRSEPPFTLPTGSLPTEEEYKEMAEPAIRRPADLPVESMAEPEPVVAPAKPTAKYQPPPDLPVV
ncbi:MAG: hypothetical protein V1684_00745 [bacterium]